MQLAIDIGAEAQRAEIRSLNVSAFSEDDLLNLILQRSEVMFDRPRSGQIIRAWNAGDLGPIKAVIADMGPEIALRAAAVIHAEYQAMKPVLAGLRPRRCADIGCGYALFDLFLARDFGTELLLIDLESNERRHFGFQEEGAAYSSLTVTKQFLIDNGLADGAIRLLNPKTEDAADAGPVDLAVSFLSCGFHYPVGLYMPFFARAVSPGGAVIVDLRATTADAQAAELASLGTLVDLDAPPKARRVHMTRAAG
jgi:SAM-dependent methyltransferase